MGGPSDDEVQEALDKFQERLDTETDEDSPSAEAQFKLRDRAKDWQNKGK